MMIESLENQDAPQLRAAEGWLELGLAKEALLELENVPEPRRHHPVALALLWRAHSELGNWRECVIAADELVQREPENPSGWIHRSYALHELKRTQKAADLLEPALAKFPKEELIPYNLACYACQLGKVDEAKALLEIAFKRGDWKTIKKRALEDSDLAPLREYLETLRR
jgi:tetratricopeptide (TPR) repeat protein